MATPAEIERRIEENDAARSAKRSAVAKRVGELAQRWAATREQLADIERELGDVLMDAQDVIDVDELARFTDIAATDLTQWLTARTARKAARSKRKRLPASPSGANGVQGGRASQASTPMTGSEATKSEPAAPLASGPDARIPADVVA